MGHYNTYVYQLLKIILLLLLLYKISNTFVFITDFHLILSFNCNVFKPSNAEAKMWKKQANIFHFVYNNSYSFNHPFFTIPGKETVCGNKRRYKKLNNFIKPTIDYFRRTPFRAYQISYQKRFIEIGVNHCILKGFIVSSEVKQDKVF